MEGPQEIIIPAQKERRYMSCGTCKYYSYQMLQSGQNPVYKVVCEHPEIMYDFKDKYLGETTPDWCPYYGSNTRRVLIEKKINNDGFKL